MATEQSYLIALKNNNKIMHILHIRFLSIKMVGITYGFASNRPRHRIPKRTTFGCTVEAGSDGRNFIFKRVNA
jgi:hypothetical protein